MKKILTLVVLLGFGLMVGCGDDTSGKPKTSTSGVSKTTIEKTTATAADTAKK